MKFKLLSALVMCAGSLGMAPAQAASTTFAQFFQANPSAKVFTYTDLVGVPEASLTATSADSYFISTDYLGLAPVKLTLSATAAAAPVLNGSTVTQLFSGTLTMLTTVGSLNALTVTFTNAVFTAQNTTEAPTLTADDHLGSVISYSSDFADLSALFNKNFSLSFSSSTLPLTYNVGLQSLPTVKLSGTGTFAAAVPEPATWMFMAMGIGAIGLAMRSRKERLAFS